MNWTLGDLIAKGFIHIEYEKRMVKSKILYYFTILLSF